MESPIRLEVKADLTRSVESWATLVPDGLRAIGTRMVELFDYKRDSRRAENAIAVVEKAIPLMNEDAEAPDEDWLDEFLDLASKRSLADLQKMLANVLARESSTPGTIPQRYIQFMAAIDMEVVDEFIDFCQWVVPSIKQVVVNDDIFIPDALIEARLVEVFAVGHSISANRDVRHPIIVGGVTHWFNFPRGTNAPLGKYSLTSFGKLVFDLLDPKPTRSPEADEFLLTLWGPYKEATE